MNQRPPAKIALTGAAGNIGYALAFRIARGELLGPRQPVDLRLIEVEPALTKLCGVAMEVSDCASPLLARMSITSDLSVGFRDADYAILVGARPRTAGMERGDLIRVNAPIFAAQGRALARHAASGVRVLVVGNPANTNALVCLANARGLDSRQFTAMTRLDHNRAVAQVAKRLRTPVGDVRGVAVWGNHSSTQFPDLSHCTVRGKPVLAQIDHHWYAHRFTPTIQHRGTAVIEVRGMSSAGSAACAVVDHVKSWVSGTPEGDWTSMAVLSQGEYGITPGLVFSYPVTCAGGGWAMVQGLGIDAYSRRMLEETEQELLEERQAVSSML